MANAEQAKNNPSNRLTLFQFLTEAGCEVVVSESGHEAIAELHKTSLPPVAILDLASPGMSGRLHPCPRGRDGKPWFPIQIHARRTGFDFDPVASHFHSIPNPVREIMRHLSFF